MQLRPSGPLGKQLLRPSLVKPHLRWTRIRAVAHKGHLLPNLEPRLVAFSGDTLQSLQRENLKLRVVLQTLHWPRLLRFHAGGETHELPCRSVRSTRASLPAAAEETLHYLAGFFDGDGCVEGHLEGCQLVVGQSFDKAEVLMLFQAVFGGSIFKQSDGRGLWKPMLKWSLWGPDVCRAARLLGPYSITKHRQLVLAADWPKSTSSRQKCLVELRRLKRCDSAVVTTCSTEYFAGFFDADGYIRITGRAGLVLRIGQKFETVLSCLKQAAARNFGVEAKLYRVHSSSTLYIFGISVCKDVLRALVEAGLLCKREQAKLAISLTARNAAQVCSDMVDRLGNQQCGKRQDLAGRMRAQKLSNLQTRAKAGRLPNSQLRELERLRKKLKQHEFISQVKNHGFQHPAKLLFHGLDHKEMKAVMLEDLLFLDRWKPPAFLTRTANPQAMEEFKALLVRNYKNFLKAWRHCLDQGCWPVVTNWIVQRFNRVPWTRLWLPLGREPLQPCCRLLRPTCRTIACAHSLRTPQPSPTAVSEEALGILRQENLKLRATLKTMAWPRLIRFQGCGEVHGLPFRSEDWVPPPAPAEGVLRYLAGFFDGDGCVEGHVSGCRLSVGQSFDKADVLMLFQEVFGGTIAKLCDGTGLRRPALQWRIYGLAVHRATRVLAQYSITKQRQLVLAADWPQEASRRQESIAELCRLKRCDSAVVAACSTEYFTGFFDAEGHICAVGRTALQLQIAQKFETVLHCLQEFLARDLGIRTTVAGHDSFRLNIYNTSETKKVLRTMLKAGMLCKADQAALAMALTKETSVDVRARLAELVGNQGYARKYDEAGRARARQIANMTRNSGKLDTEQLRQLERRNMEHQIMKAQHANQQLRKYIDKIQGLSGELWADSSNRCNYDEFDAACQKLKFKGDVAGAWRALDEDLSGYITLQEIDPASSSALANFRRWCDEEFGSVRSAFSVFDNSGDNEVNYREWRRSLRFYGFEGDASTLFYALDVERSGTLALQEVEFLDEWIFPGASTTQEASSSTFSSQVLGEPPVPQHVTTQYVTEGPGPAAYAAGHGVGSGPPAPMRPFPGAFSFRKRTGGTMLLPPTPRDAGEEPSPLDYDSRPGWSSMAPSKPSWPFSKEARKSNEPVDNEEEEQSPGPGAYTPLMAPAVAVACTPRRALKVHPFFREGLGKRTHFTPRQDILALPRV
ncbi:unnamed protein product [Symbiodinium sp. CCMP2592]|nr:unnamed protein product [Symbiodinium sp. CCMP2592]